MCRSVAGVLLIFSGYDFPPGEICRRIPSCHIYMSSSLRIGLFLFSLFLLSSCRTHKGKDEQLVFWCANNPREIDLCISATDQWNHTHPGNTVPLQPVPEGQSSE